MIKMKQVIFIAISILFFSCNKTDEFEFEYCERIEELSAPNGLKLNRVSSIEFNGNFKELQFINDNVGYLLGQNSVGGYADVFKSIDGGKTWTNINLTLRENPINMFFLNEQIGFISYYGENGNLLKTINAGESWEKISYSELNGNLYHIQSDNSNNLYAMLSGLETQKKILKSTNEGVSWEVINQSNEIDFELVTFSFQVHEEALYISGKSGKLIITDLDGNEIKTIETNLSYIWDLDIIDLNNYVITSSEKTIKSTDGGVSWTEIYDKSRNQSFKKSIPELYELLKYTK